MPKFVQSIRFKIGLTILVLQTSVLMAFGFYYIDRFNKQLEKRVLNQLHIPASLLGRTSLEITSNSDLDTIRRLTNQNIIESFVAGSEGIIFFSSDARYEGQSLLTFLKNTPLQLTLGEWQQKVHWNDNADKHSVSFIDPLIYENELIGYLYLKVDTSEMYGEKTEIVQLFIAGSILCILLTTLTELILVNRLVGPRLRQMLVVLKSSERGNLSARIHDINSLDEIGTLQQGINRMIISIESRTKALQDIQDQLEQRVEKRTKELSESNKKLEELAYTDPLTNISNRRHFLEQVKCEVVRAQRYHRPLLAMMLDIDFFKKVNDEYGHDTGDEVLKIVASVCSKMIRENDIFGRLGGEEFGLVMPEINIDDGCLIAERIRQKIANVKIDLGGKQIKVSVSIGLSVLVSQGDCVETLLKRADEALYKAKSKGRNKVYYDFPKTTSL